MVQFVDEKSGKPVPVEWVRAKSTSADGQRSDVSAVGEGEGDQIRYLVHAAVGRLSIGVIDSKWQDEQREYEVVAGRNEIRIQASAASALEVSFRHGELVVPFNHTAGIEARRIDGEGRATSGSFNGKTAHIVLSSPGLYRLTVKGIDGFAPIEAQQVHVGSGETKRVVIELQAKP